MGRTEVCTDNTTRGEVNQFDSGIKIMLCAVYHVLLLCVCSELIYLRTDVGTDVLMC